MRSTLLLVDGIINLLLGALLLWYPLELARAVGLPADQRPFFGSILGAVLFGIGIALLIERSRQPGGVIGLGLGGAVAINLCGGIVLAAWLAFGTLPLTGLGMATLWLLVVLLIGLSSVELIARTHER